MQTRSFAQTLHRSLTLWVLALGALALGPRLAWSQTPSPLQEWQYSGGIILATADSRADIEAVIELDPFKEAGAASYTITEFVPTMTADILSAFKQA